MNENDHRYFSFMCVANLDRSLIIQYYKVKHLNVKSSNTRNFFLFLIHVLLLYMCLLIYVCILLLNLCIGSMVKNFKYLKCL